MRSEHTCRRWQEIVLGYFQNNRQQDAHEWLVSILDNIRAVSRAAEPDEGARPGWDSGADDFQGTMVARIGCMDCGKETELLYVPFGKDDTPTSQHLRGMNKYFCRRCRRKTEAMLTVTFFRLPGILVKHQKRYSVDMEEITYRYVPTSLLTPSYCEPCPEHPAGCPPTHRYNLWTVIMREGQRPSKGYYVVYARSDREHGRAGHAAGLRHSKLFMERIESGWTKKLWKYSKRQLRIITGVFTGHFGVKGLLAKLGLSDNTDCRMCGEEAETMKHILCGCHALARLRMKEFGNGYPEPKEFQALPLGSVIRYMEVVEQAFV